MGAEKKEMGHDFIIICMNTGMYTMEIDGMIGNQVSAQVLPREERGDISENRTDLHIFISGVNGVNSFIYAVSPVCEWGRGLGV